MRGTYFRVGLLLLLGVGLLTGMVIYLNSTTIRYGLTLETYFLDSVQGLDAGAPVKYRGVTIGQVTQIALAAAEYGGAPADAIDEGSAYRAVLVRFEVDTTRIGRMPAIDTLVRQGMRARIAPQGLTGLSYLSLDFADPAKNPSLAVPWTPRRAYIPSMPGTLSVVQDAATSLLVRAQKVDFEGLADAASKLIAEVRGSLREGDVHQTLTQTTATLAAIRGVLAASDIPALTAELRSTLAAAKGLAQGPQTRDLLRNATLAADRLAQATAKLPALLASLDTVARRADSGSADLEAALTPLLRDARVSLTALREMTQALRRDPAQILVQGPPPRDAAP